MALTEKNLVWKATLDTSGLKKGADEVTRGFQEISEAERKAKEEAEKYQKSSEKVGKSSGMLEKLKKNWLAVVGAVTAVVAVMNKVLSSVAEYIGLAEAQLTAEKKLETILKQRTNATNAEIQSIKDLTAAQQQLGIIGDEVQLAGAQQISTFVTQTESVEKLIPAMNNLLAQTAGLNASQGDAVNIGNLMGKVLMGEVGALRRVGISFSEAEEQILKFGTESEKAAMLAQVITNNVGNMNEELAKTDSGRIQQAKNAIGDFKELIGMFLLPLVAKLFEGFTKVLNIAQNIGKVIGNAIKPVENLSIAQERYNSYVDETNKVITTERVNIEKLLNIAKNEKRSKEERLAAIKEINKISPEYLGNIKLENINTKDVIKAVDNYIDALEDKIKAQVASAKLSDIMAEKFESEILWYDQKLKLQKLENELLDSNKSEFERENIKRQIELEKSFLPLGDIRNQQLDEEIKKYQQILDDLGVQFEFIKRNRTIESEGIVKSETTKLKYKIDPFRDIEDAKEKARIQAELAKQQEELLLSLISDGLEKRLRLVELEYAEKIKLAEKNGAIIEDIERQRDEELLRISRQYYKELADEQMASYEQEQEIAKLKYESTTQNENKKNEFILKQQIAAYNERLEIDKSLTEQEIQLITLRKNAAQLELNTLQQTSTVIAGIFAQIGASLEQINTQQINSVKDFGRVLYETTKTNIKNYLAETTAIAIKNAMLTSGNPVLGLVLGGAASLAIKTLFDKLLPQMPQFESGGIVGGSSYYGDNVMARVNSGEMILNREQQQKLFNIANGKGTANNISLEKTNNILREQINLLQKQKNFVQIGNKLYSINSQTGRIIDKKII